MGPFGRRVALVGLIVCIAGGVAFAQRGRNRRPQLDVEVQGNTPYDGRFVFVRLKYDAGFGRWGNHIGDGGIPMRVIICRGQKSAYGCKDRLANLDCVRCGRGVRNGDLAKIRREDE